MSPNKHVPIDKRIQNPEPVPSASQLAILPFLAAIDGFIQADPNDRFRMTMHRTMLREGAGYLQQAAPYIGIEDKGWKSKVGRIFPVTTGIIGAAFSKKKIYRTRSYETLDLLRKHLLEDMAETGDDRNINNVAVSYLAIPILDASDNSVLILYAETFRLNFFADNDLINRIHAMCVGFARLLDWLQKNPYPKMRNFPLRAGKPTEMATTVYPRIQEALATPAAPKLKRLTSFNYEATS